MKYFALTFLFAFIFCSCAKIQTQQISENKTQPTQISTNANNTSEEIGYPRFTTSDKQYLGCWRSIKAEEVIEYELKFFRLTENKIQTSKMSKPIAYKEAESNNYKDYFVLQTESKNDELRMFLSINMVNNDEITIQEFSTKNDITIGESKNYWVLKREDCNKVLKKFKNK